MKQQFILAVDFDGTIAETEDDYIPRKLMSNVKQVLDWAKKKNCYIIIWTCRSGKLLQQARKFLKDKNISYDIVNENVPWIDLETSRKIYYDFLIDDKCFEIDWLKIKTLISKKLISKFADQIEKLEKENV